MAANDPTHLSHFNLKLNGQQASKEMMEDFLDCTVENSVHLPDLCTVRFYDAKFQWLDSSSLEEGTLVEVSGCQENAQQLIPLFTGEVAGLEMDLAAHGTPTLIIRCYDKSHRLNRGRISKTYMQMKDSDIVKKIANEEGFTPHIEETTEVHDHIWQHNQTNWEFLQVRAAANGYRLYLQGEKDLHFEKVKDQGPGDTITLEWGKDLRSFRPRTEANNQVDEVSVRGWDPKTKKSIVGNCKSPSGSAQIGDSKTGGDVAKKAFGSAKMVVTDRPVHSQSEADDLARSVCDDLGSSFVEAEGLCYGQPKMKPGSVVEIKNIGKRFSGKYQVTSTTHTYTPAEGFTTQFSISGKTPASLLSLIHEQGSGARAKNGDNIVVGVVTDNMDPDNKGRVKVMYPWLSEDDTSFWARQSAPMAGGGRGFYFIPEIGDEVLVALEHGDFRRPYIIGSLWNGVDKPIEGNSDAIQSGKVNRRTIKTRIGHTILLDDTDGKGEIRLETANHHFLSLNDRDRQIVLWTKAGHRIFLSDADETIVIVDITNSNKMTINSNDGSISFECVGDFNVTAGGNITFTSAATLNAQAMAGINIMTPAAMELTATAEMTETVGGMMTQTVGGLMNQTVGGALTQSIGGAWAINITAAGAVSAGATFAITSATIPITGVVEVTGAVLIDGIPA